MRMKPCSGKSRIIPRIMYAYQRLLLGGRDKHVLSFYCLLVNTTLHARPERKFLKAVHKSPHATLGGTRGYSNNAFSMPCKILELTDSGSKRWLASIPSLIVYLSDRLLILSNAKVVGKTRYKSPSSSSSLRSIALLLSSIPPRVDLYSSLVIWSSACLKDEIHRLNHHGGVGTGHR